MRASSLARWKYLIWSGVRQGAMECLRSRFDPKQTRDAIAATLASPSRLSYAHQGSFDGFLPRTDTPHSFASSPVVYCGIDFTSLATCYSMTQRHMQGVTWEDLKNSNK